ncbi:DUF6461 domain-containing protein [Actinocorallia sp. B10E7]|uniref:DUF6461 domain-containing protein n=1 Tax=Actinocorallia sp. B10E7 TaxID=3153558 RepID=UPI00325F6EBE
MINVSAADYAWAEDEDYNEIPQEYCLTLVQGLSPWEFLHRIGAEAGPAVTGIRALAERTWPREDSGMCIGVSEINGWALGVEINGFLGVREEINVPLSAGTRLVSHFRNVNAVSDFVWREDGDLRLGFDPLFAGTRYGSAPDALLEVMAAIGFTITDRDEDAEDFGAVIDGAYALAEHLTGIRITPGFLTTATYQCGIVHR